MQHRLAESIESYVPHRGAMLLLDQLIEVNEEWAVTQAVVREDGLFVRDGRLPAWIGIEYMAQTISVWSGGRALREGLQPRVGLLLGSRRYEVTCADFAVGAVLRIEAKHEFVGENGLGMFDCRILQAGEELARAKVCVFDAVGGVDVMKNMTLK